MRTQICFYLMSQSQHSRVIPPQSQPPISRVTGDANLPAQYYCPLNLHILAIHFTFFICPHKRGGSKSSGARSEVTTLAPTNPSWWKPGNEKWKAISTFRNVNLLSSSFRGYLHGNCNFAPIDVSMSNLLLKSSPSVFKNKISGECFFLWLGSVFLWAEIRCDVVFLMQILLDENMNIANSIIPYLIHFIVLYNKANINMWFMSFEVFKLNC